jgi:hypothetical protein
VACGLCGNAVAPDEYCREIESYLCRKNDGHLIRIVGPAFEHVSGWAREGIPLKIALAGVDRYFERYYRKGPRRRPVRIEFCEADIRDAFDDWRRVLGAAALPPDAEPQNESAPPRRGSLPSHLERVIARLTTLRGSVHGLSGLAGPIDRIARELDALQTDARRRGAARELVLTRLTQLDAELMAAAAAGLTADEMGLLASEADAELAQFRARMTPDAYIKSHRAAVEQLVREKTGLPRLTFDG